MFDHQSILETIQATCASKNVCKRLLGHQVVELVRTLLKLYCLYLGLVVKIIL